MSSVQAETLLYYLQNQNQVSFAKVYDRTGDAVICYEGERAAVIRMIQLFHYEEVELPTGLLESSGRALNNEYQEKLISKVIYHFGRKWLLPAPIRAIYTTVVSVKYIWKSRHWHRERSKFRFLMQPQSVFRCSAATMEPQALSCSCSA